MSYAVTLGYSSAKIAAATITAITPLPGALALSYIHKVGATFRTGAAPGNLPTQTGDGATIAGSGAGNNGTYLVVDVPDEELLIVRGTMAAEGAVPTVSVVHSDHQLDIVGETAVDWATIETNAAEIGVIRHTNVGGLPAAAAWTAYLHAFTRVYLDHVSAVDINFTSKREIVIFARTTVTAWKIMNRAGSNGQILLNLGELKSSDRRSYVNGSVWTGVRFIALLGSWEWHAYGSMLIGDALDSGHDSEFYGVINAGNISMQAGDVTLGHSFQDMIQWSHNSTPTAILAPLLHAGNYLLGYSPSAPVMFGTFNTVRITEFGDNDQLPAPLYTLLNINVELADMLVDEPVTNILNALSGSTGKKIYTYNPIITDEEGNPVVGATVYITVFDDSILTETQISGSPFTTDANGHINSGTEMLIQETVTTGVVINYSHRVVVMVKGYRICNTIVKLNHPMSSRLPLRLYDPAFEGEEATL